MQGEETGNYGLVSTNEGGIGGGVFPTTEDMPARSYVTFYVQVDDLQAALDKMASMGGNASMPPMEIAPGMGSIAMFGDSADNTIGLYSLPPEWDGQMPPNGNAPPVVHFEVGGSDAAVLAEFYTGMFDWQIHRAWLSVVPSFPTTPACTLGWSARLVCLTSKRYRTLAFRSMPNKSRSPRGCAPVVTLPPTDSLPVVLVDVGRSSQRFSGTSGPPANR